MALGVALELSQDPVGIQEVLNKEDTHSLNEKAFSLPSRLIAKIYLFRTIFRGSGWSFANDPNFMHVSSDPAYWDNVNEKFYEKYNGLDKKHKEWAQLVASGKSITSPLGRFWPIEMGVDKKGNIFIPWTILTNYPVQGTGTDVMTIARIVFAKRLAQRGWKQVLLVSSVHDSIVVDAPADMLKPVAQLFHEVFDDLQANIWRTFKYKWVVPLACEVKYGPNMKSMKKLDRAEVM